MITLLPIVMLASPLKFPVAAYPDDCGACITNSIIQHVTPDLHYVPLEWFQTNTCTGWNVWESTNWMLPSTNWWLNNTMWNAGGGSNRNVRLVVFSSNNPTYFRVSAY